MKAIKYFAAFLLIASATYTADAQKLVILHTNDSHSQIETCRVGRENGYGGVERRLQYINQVRNHYGKKKVLILDAGDYNQGTPYFTLGKGDLEVELENALHYDVATLGNHEFDNGKEELARRLKSAKYTSLACNYDFSATCLGKVIKPYTILKRGGMKIGIIGATSYLEGNVLKEHTDGLVRLNTVEEVNKWADFLKNKKKCDLVILLSHLGFASDRATDWIPSDIYMVSHSRNLDIVVGGHSHTFLKNAKEVADLDGRIVPIVQTGCKGVNVGKFEIY